MIEGGIMQKNIQNQQQIEQQKMIHNQQQQQQQMMQEQKLQQMILLQQRQQQEKDNFAVCFVFYILKNNLNFMNFCKHLLEFYFSIIDIYLQFKLPSTIDQNFKRL